MENQRKIPKRIFSLFLAILCTFGILFVSYIDSFADTFSLGLKLTRLYSNSAIVHICNADGSEIYQGNNLSAYTYFSCSLDQSYIYIVAYTSFNLSINGGSVESFSSRGTYLRYVDPTDGLLLYISSISTQSGNRPVTVEIHFNLPTPTPTPTPTPAPATPTPNPYDPGGVPTPTGDYGAFFERMAADAQNAFNAIYLSWNGANSRFYSGIFFIGLPLLIGLFGLVASIILGDDD